MNLIVNQTNAELIKEKNYNDIMQEWVDNNGLLMYSRYNEGKSGIAERFIKTLKTKFYKKRKLMIANFFCLI